MFIKAQIKIDVEIEVDDKYRFLDEVEDDKEEDKRIQYLTEVIDIIQNKYNITNQDNIYYIGSGKEDWYVW